MPIQMPLLRKLPPSIVLICLSFSIVADDTTNTAGPAPVVSYDRMYVDSEGVSHFGKSEFAFVIENYSPPADPIAIHSLANVQGATLVFIPKDTFEDWHPAPRRQFAFILKGAVEVTVSDGEVRQFEPGSIVLLEDTTGPGHTTRVIGDEDHLSVMVPVAELSTSSHGE